MVRWLAIVESIRSCIAFAYRTCAIFSPTTFVIVAIEDVEVAGATFGVVGVSVTFIVVGASVTFIVVGASVTFVVVGASVIPAVVETEQDKHGRI